MIQYGIRPGQPLGHSGMIGWDGLRRAQTTSAAIYREIFRVAQTCACYQPLYAIAVTGPDNRVP